MSGTITEDTELTESTESTEKKLTKLKPSRLKNMIDLHQWATFFGLILAFLGVLCDLCGFFNALGSRTCR